ncbi:MAG: hypothetical protein M3040_02285 [Bacteroidota bacterium]|nr:hypothetical protein [Bacteroidota bacterium]
MENMLSKVPKVTLFFWVIKILATTVGETAADYLNITLGMELPAVLHRGRHPANYKYLKLNSILAFWLAYILTRPLGASLGDLLSQKVKVGGLGLGTTVTSIVFLLTILTLVIYLTIHRKSQSIEKVKA